MSVISKSKDGCLSCHPQICEKRFLSLQLSKQLKYWRLFAASIGLLFCCQLCIDLVRSTVSHFTTYFLRLQLKLQECVSNFVVVGEKTKNIHRLKRCRTCFPPFPLVWRILPFKQSWECCLSAGEETGESHSDVFNMKWVCTFSISVYYGSSDGLSTRS